MGESNSQTKAYEIDEHPFELRHEVKRLNNRLDKIADSLEKSEFKDILDNYSDPKKNYHKLNGRYIPRSGIISRNVRSPWCSGLHSQPIS